MELSKTPLLQAERTDIFFAKICLIKEKDSQNYGYDLLILKLL